VASALATSKDFDLIHSHDWLTYPAGIAAKYVSGKPLVIHVHATEFDRSGENVNPQVFAIEKKGMEEADRIIAVSNFTRNIVIEKYGIPEEKVVTVHNAVEPAEAKSINGSKYVPEKIVTFLGRITFQKGPDYFIEAARLIIERDDIRADLHIFNPFPVFLKAGIFHIHADIAGIDQPDGFLALIAVGFGYHENHVHTMFCQSFRQTETGRSQTSRNMRRKFPPEH
jgi:glycosyltransferase involved in cell wall biosynthesis